MVLSKRHSGYCEYWSYTTDNKLVWYKDSEGIHYSTENLPENVLCQVFVEERMTLEIKIKRGKTYGSIK